jgi:NADH dehydrogenase/NADH:ubiquinone oxidoreductase subunit G
MSRTILDVIYGFEILAHRGAEGEDESGDGTEGEENEDEEESEKDDKGKPKPKDPNIAAQNRKEAENRKLLKEANAKIKELSDAKEALELKDADELTKTKAALAKKEEAETKRVAALNKMAIENAALKVKIKDVEWADIDDVLDYLARADGVEVDEEGEVKGVKEALTKLAKAKPHWVKKPVAGGPTGVNSGNGTQKTGDAASTQAALIKKYRLNR